MPVVLDTNVLLDWLLFQDPAGVAIGQQVSSGALKWLSTQAMCAECLQVLQRPSLARWRTEATQTRVLEAWQHWACVLPEPAPPASQAVGARLRCRDPDDQVFINLALSESAPLLTKDKDLLALRRPARALGLWVGPPADWLTFMYLG